MTPEQIKALIEAALKDVGPGIKAIQDLVGGLQGKIGGYEATIKDLSDRLADTQKRFDTFRKAGARMDPATRTRRGLGSDELNGAFGKALVQLARKRTYDEAVFTKAAAVDDTYIVGVEYATEIIRLVEAQGVARRIARRIPMGTGTTDWPRRTGGVSGGHVAKGNAITASLATAGQVQLIADVIMAACPVQNASMEDALIDLGSFVVEEIAYEFARIEDVDMIQGDGTATFGGIKGLLSDALFAVAANCPTTVSLPKGKTSFEDVTFDDLQNCIDGVKSQALPRGRWLLHRSVLSIVRGIKDNNGRYIWEPAGASGNPQTILGYPYETMDAMPARAADAANKRFIAFGSFDHWYFGDRRAIDIVADESLLRLSNQTIFVGSERTAQGLSDGGAFSVLKTAAN